jgi:hypothetical protein
MRAPKIAEHNFQPEHFSQSKYPASTLAMKKIAKMINMPISSALK